MILNNLDFLFIGGIFPKENEEEIIRKSKHGLQMAANNLQWSLIHGFDHHLENPVKIMNTIFVGSYPGNYRDYLIKSYHFSHTSGADDINLGFINLTILKQFLRPVGEKSFLKKWSQKNKETSNKVVFIYSLSPRSVKIAKELKKLNPNIFVCVSVLDLPENTMLGKKGKLKIAQLWKAISKKQVAIGLKYIDGFMIVTEQIAKKLNISNKPHVIIETLIETDEDILTYPLKNIDSIKRVVYTGGLIEKYGILNLIHAFMQIESKDFKLIICGDGDCKDQIMEFSKTDNRIEYLGVLPLVEIKKIQQSATVLVNPTQNTGDFTKYSFPIKTIEYLLSGVPVIAYKLDGIPFEYDEHLIYIEDNSIEALKNKIIQVCNLSEDQRIKINYKNRKFVLEQKNHIFQTKQILKMISGNISKT